MKQETQWTTIFWEGWTAQALCAAAVFWPGSAALRYPAVLWPGLALAVADTYHHRGGFSLSGCARLWRGGRARLR